MPWPRRPRQGHVPWSGRDKRRTRRRLARRRRAAPALVGRRRSGSPPGRHDVPASPGTARRSIGTRLHVVPRPARVTTSRPPSRSARDRIPASPRCPSGTPAGSKPRPSSVTRSRTVAHGATPDPDLAGAGVLDDVVERLLRDPVQRLLDLDRRPIRQVGLDHDRAARCARTATRSACAAPGSARAPRRCPAAARRSAPASPRGPRAAAPGATRASPAPAAGSLSSSSSIDAREQGHREQRLGHGVVQLAGEVGALLGRGELGGLAPEALLEALALRHVARRPVRAEERAVGDHADARHLHRELVPVAGQHLEARPVGDRRPAGEPAEPGERAAPAGRRGEVRERAPDELLGRPPEDRPRLVRDEREPARRRRSSRRGRARTARGSGSAPRSRAARARGARARPRRGRCRRRSPPRRRPHGDGRDLERPVRAVRWRRPSASWVRPAGRRSASRAHSALPSTEDSAMNSRNGRPSTSSGSQPRRSATGPRRTRSAPDRLVAQIRSGDDWITDR